MKFLIAGGAGFIGANLCKLLLDEGNEVIVYDNLSTGRWDNLEPFSSNKNLTFELQDVKNLKISSNLKLDGIFNLASPASPSSYQSKPIETLMTNVLGAFNLLSIASRKNIRIVQASTSEVYGDPLVSPQIESYWGNVNPVGPRSCYDEGKRAAEALFFDFQREEKTDIRVARIFNTYGPLMAPNDGRVVSNFIVQALNNSPITIYGTGSQTRSFCFVDDLVIGLKQLMNEPGIQGPINLGNTQTLSIIELAKLVVSIADSKSKLVFKPSPVDDPKVRVPDLTLARNLLNFNPTVSISEGLFKTIEYFKKKL